jgi:hypothetical protein
MYKGIDATARPFGERNARLAAILGAARSADVKFGRAEVFPLDFIERLAEGKQGFPIAGVCITNPRLASGIAGEPVMFVWRVIDDIHPVVLVKVLREEMKCLALVEDTGGMKDVIDFGVAKPYLLAMDDQCVELDYSRGEKQWKIRRLSAEKPWKYSRWRELFIDGSLPLSIGEIRDFVATMNVGARQG